MQSALEDSSTVGLLSNANCMVASGNLQIEQPKISADRTAMTKSLHKGLIRMMKGSFVEEFCHCCSACGDHWLLILGFNELTDSIQMKFVPNLKIETFCDGNSASSHLASEYAHPMLAPVRSRHPLLLAAC